MVNTEPGQECYGWTCPCSAEEHQLVESVQQFSLECSTTVQNQARKAIVELVYAMQKNSSWHNLLRSWVVNTTVQNLARNAMVEPVHKQCRRTSAGIICLEVQWLIPLYRIWPSIIWLNLSVQCRRKLIVESGQCSAVNSPLKNLTRNALVEPICIAPMVWAFRYCTAPCDT